MKRTMNITELVNNYRDASRTLWNAHLRKNYGKFSGAGIDECFEEICDLMFKSIVLAPVTEERPDDYFLGFKCNFIKVRLKNGKNLDISREKGHAHEYGGHQINSLKTDVDLNFINLFDWDSYGFLEMSLVKAEIVKCEEHPDLVGHRLLARIANVDFEFCLDSYNARTP